MPRQVGARGVQFDLRRAHFYGDKRAKTDRLGEYGEHLRGVGTGDTFHRTPKVAVLATWT